MLALLDSGEIDLVCGVFPEKVKEHKEQRLLQESYVCVCRRGHPLIDSPLSLEEYFAVLHLLVAVKEDRIGRVDALLAKENLKRHVALFVPHFLVSPSLLAQTDLVATLTHRIAITFAQYQSLKLLPLPLLVTGFSACMRWHRATKNSPACQWRDCLSWQ